MIIQSFLFLKHRLVYRLLSSSSLKSGSILWPLSISITWNISSSCSQPTVHKPFRAESRADDRSLHSHQRHHSTTIIIPNSEIQKEYEKSLFTVLTAVIKLKIIVSTCQPVDFFASGFAARRDSITTPIDWTFQRSKKPFPTERDSTNLFSMWIVQKHLSDGRSPVDNMFDLAKESDGSQT